MEKKILIAVDGSAYSFEALEYIALLFTGQTDIHFHLTTCISAGENIMVSSMDSANSLLPGTTGSEKKRTAALSLLKSARDKLIRMKILPDLISFSAESSGQNIANTLQYLAEEMLVDGILIGRRGLNSISEMLLGSVSSTLLNKCHQIPLWIIDGEVQNKHFLAAVNGTISSLLAIDHLAHIMEGRKDITVFLFHCHRLLKKQQAVNPETFYPVWGKDWCDTHLAAPDHIFRGPAQLLKEAGIPEEQIIILPEVPDLEEAHAILHQAEKNQCGTIIMGRRGEGTAKGILGGVSDRALKHAQNIALWVVG